MKIKIDLDKLPKKIVLSRKGTDSSWGRSPSLRIGDDLISLPIPEHKGRCDAKQTHLTYGDLPVHPRVGKYVDYLPSLKSTDCVHLDPDIRPPLRVDSHTAKLLFGQSGAAQKHLENQGICDGDLFLFFGWFREFKKHMEYEYKPIGPDQHVIWGWFQIAKKHSVTTHQAADALKWAKHHPHVSHWERPAGAKKKNNTLYVATERLSFLPSLPGAGCFDWSSSRCLTSQQQKCGMGSEPTRTQWCVPSFLADTELTYNNPARNEACECPGSSKRIHMTSASIGQEFVFPKSKRGDAQQHPLNDQLQGEIGEWLDEVFDGVHA